MLLKLNSVTLRVGSKRLLADTSWEFLEDQHWAIMGPNGSGKSSLVKALWGGVPLCAGRIDPALDKDDIGYVSFELHLNMTAQESEKDMMRYFAGKTDEFTTVEEVIGSAVKTSEAKRVQELMQQLGISHLAGRAASVASTGEMRKILIARALMKKPRLLILDEPFDGLDKSSKAAFMQTVSELMQGDMRVALIVHRLEEVLPEITHVLTLKDGSVNLQGSREDVLPQLKASHLLSDIEHAKVDHLYEDCNWPLDGALIRMEDVHVSYGNKVVFDGLSWTMNGGENWRVLGPNGSGKSTLVRLITGENVQGYANKIWLFGEAKGSHESLWAIRKNIGVVSAEMQVQYRKNMSAFDVICSGFYDSIGLYSRPTIKEHETATEWARVLHIEDMLDLNFAHMSYGQKRMILLARAMVKCPRLLIVDEPTHGLDSVNRARILRILEQIGETPSSLLMITHHEDEDLACIGRTLNLGDSEL